MKKHIVADKTNHPHKSAKRTTPSILNLKVQNVKKTPIHCQQGCTRVARLETSIKIGAKQIHKEHLFSTSVNILIHHSGRTSSVSRWECNGVLKSRLCHVPSTSKSHIL